MPPFEQTSHRNYILRKFSPSLEESELKWHYDEQDRYVVPINENDWYFQLDDNLPRKFNSPVFIPKNTYHRVIKGSTVLECKIYKEGERELPTYAKAMGWASGFNGRAT